MTEQMRGPDATAPDGSKRDGMPRWVKVLLIAVVVLVVLLVLTQLLGIGGGHGPGRHGAAPLRHWFEATA